MPVEVKKYTLHFSVADVKHNQRATRVGALRPL